MFCATAVLFSGTLVFADAALPQQSPHEPRPVFRDDFVTDTRSDYATTGDVKWQEGVLSLTTGASIERGVGGGARATLSVDFGPAEVQPLEVRIWMLFDGVTDGFIRVRRHETEDGTVCQVAIVDTWEEDGKLGEFLIRERSLGGTAPGRLRIEYQYGLIRVSADGAPAVMGYVSNKDAALRAMKIIVPSGTCVLEALQADCTPAPRPLSPEQQEQLERAKKANEAFNRLYRVGKLDDAQAAAEEVLRIRKSVLGESHVEFGNGLNDLGLLYLRRGDTERAQKLFRRVLQTWKPILGEQHPSYATCLDNLAGAFKRGGDYEQAEPLFQQALAIRRTALGADSRRFAHSQLTLARLYAEMARYQKAEPLFLGAKEVLGQTVGEEHTDYAVVLDSLGGMYREQGDYARAMPLIAQALRIRQAALGTDHFQCGVSLSHLGLVHKMAGDYARAIPLFQQARDILRATLGERHPNYGAILNNLAVLHLELGDYTHAEPLFEESLGIRKAVFGERHLVVAETMNNLARLKEGLREYDRAEQLYEQVLVIQREVLGERHPGYAVGLNNLAGLCQRTRQHERAKELYTESLSIRAETSGPRSPDYATSLNNLAQLHHRTGDYGEAVRLYQQTLGILEATVSEFHLSVVIARCNLAETYTHMGNESLAEANYLKALHLIRSNLDRNALAQSERQQKRNLASERYILDGYLTHVIRSGGSAAAALAEVWRWKGAVTLRQRALRQLGADSALAGSLGELRAAARELAALSAHAPTPPRPGASETDEQNFAKEQRRWQEEFRQLIQEHRELQQGIATRSSLFAETISAPSVADVRQRLPDGTAFVDFLEYDHMTPVADSPGRQTHQRRFVAFVVRPNRPPALVEVGSVSTLSEAITAFRRPFAAEHDSVSSREQAARAADAIRRQLWSPVEAHLQGVTTVILSPDTILGTLPFAALPGRGEGRFLVEDYRLAAVPMAQLLSREHTVRAKPGLLVLGDVDYESREAGPDDAPKLLAVANGLRSGVRRDWGVLPGFRAELDSVSALFRRRFGKDAPTRVLQGAEATGESLLHRLPQFGTLHLITHAYFEGPETRSIGQTPAGPPSDETAGRRTGFLNAWMPSLLSGLVLAGANAPRGGSGDGSDGILRASEIETATLEGVDLVVLSACETGLGAVAGGEGLTGLQRAFQVAGARTVVASLWKVDDRATHELMKRFYTNLWIHGQSRLDALRNAQLWMLRHPAELVALGVKSPRVRGVPRVRRDPAPKGESVGGRTSPFFWAAFSLSGDWR